MRRRVHRFLFPSLAAVTALALTIACGEPGATIPDTELPDTGVKPSGDDTSALDAGVLDAANDGPPRYVQRQRNLGRPMLRQPFFMLP